MNNLLRHHSQRLDDPDYDNDSTESDRRRDASRAADRDNTRPRSMFSPSGAPLGERVRRVLNLPEARNVNLLREDDEHQDSDPPTDDSSHVIVLNRRQNRRHHTSPEESALPATATALAPQLPVAPSPQADHLPAHTNTSALCRAAWRIIQDALPTNTLAADLAWQQQLEGDPIRIKTFRTEALQQVDIVIFAYMRPSSPFINLLHSAAPFSLPSGDMHYRGKDIGFVGDRTDIRVPTPIVLAPEQPWKWLTKRITLDIGPLDLFYADPENATKFYHPPDRATDNPCVSPRLLAIPPHLVQFCATEPTTPYQFHNHITAFVSAEGSPVTLEQCRCVLQWCIMAAHHDTNPASSMLAFVLEPALSTDDMFNRWLQRRLIQTLGPLTPRLPPLPAPQPAPPGNPPGFSLAPPPDMWNQFASNLTQGLATAAAALNPQPRAPTGDSTTYEDGGKYYDAYQLAVIQGFSHTASLAGIPPIWALFQHTKHLDTHRDNIKRKMVAWAEAQRRHVAIDRGLYISNASLREILALKFNPGGAAAEVSTADQGISILMCRSRSTESKSSIRRRELIEHRMSKSSISFSDAEKTIERDSATCPDDYNELLRCLGTFCALLHTLFGSRCGFFVHCTRLLHSLDSEYVYDRRRFFTATFCRQLVWAMVEEGREYFSHRLSPSDFEGVHPDDIEYPESNVLELLPHIRNQTPLFRSSFPLQWNTTQSSITSARDGGSVALPHQHAPPVQAVNTQPTIAPSVISGVSNATSLPPPVGQIRETNIHPLIKTTMSDYIKKFRSVRLNQLLEHMGLTIADLPTLPVMATSTTSICYNFVLGKCVHSGCLHKHVDAVDVTDDFAEKITSTLTPAIQSFLTNGAPNQPRRKRRRRAE